MSFGDLGTVAALIMAIAAIVTLAYLALQIRHNSQVVRASTHHALINSWNELNLAIATDRGLARIWRSGSSDFKALNDEEQLSFAGANLAMFQIYETAYFQRALGTTDESKFTAMLQGMRALLGLPGIRDWWTTNPFPFSDEFSEFVASEIEAIQT